MLTTFLNAYITCAIWSSTDQDDDNTPLDKNFTPNDLSPQALVTMRADCERFLQESGLAPTHPLWHETRAGHDFWLTRNHHGAGFWDGDWPEPLATRLTDLAHTFKEQTLYVGDDNKLHLM